MGSGPSCDVERRGVLPAAEPVDLSAAIGEQMKVLAWYDNEMGSSQRLFDLARFVGERL